MREHTCCFTGHRLHKLPWGGDEDHPQCLLLRARLAQAIEDAAHQGVTHFISGMAQGVDLWAAQAVLALRETMPLQLEAALPFDGQALRWKQDTCRRYQQVLAQCDRVTLVSPAYHPACFEQRNRYMVARSAMIIAVYSGGRGGTRQTLAMAGKQGLQVVLLDPREGSAGMQAQVRMPL